jgi:hypothetical protein
MAPDQPAGIPTDLPTAASDHLYLEPGDVVPEIEILVGDAGTVEANRLDDPSRRFDEQANVTAET